MKRVLTAILATVLCLALCACEVADEPKTTGQNQTQKVEGEENKLAQGSNDNIPQDNTAITDEKSQATGQTQPKEPEREENKNEQKPNNTKPQDNTAALKQQQISAAKTAFDALLLAEDACVAAMDSIYPAWHFAVYESGKFTYATDCYKAYIEATKLDYDRTLELLNADLENLNREVNGQTQIAYLEDIGTAVDLVLLAYYDNGVFSAVEQNLNTAKEALQSVTDQFAGDTGCVELKKYYAEIASYFEYIKSPTGSFDDLGALVNTYETNMRTYRISLEILLK